MAQYANYTDIKIGASVGGLVSVTTLGSGTCPPPKTYFQQHAEVRETADGNVRGLGKPVIVWVFRNIPYAAVDALRDQMTDPDMSGARYIASPDKDMMMQNWAVVMQWPNEPSAYEAFDRWEELTIRFVRCIQQA